MNDIREQINRCANTFEFNYGDMDEVREAGEELQQLALELLAVYEAALVVCSEGAQHHWEAMNTLSSAVNDLVQPSHETLPGFKDVKGILSENPDDWPDATPEGHDHG